MYVIGTAGHIDHGKSTLIQALTKMNPDRLHEERARGMTIDLGFAWLTLPSGIEAGIVDVPGHHRFIENMLAGVGGIRLTLFVIALDDGWMPQTEEHLEILDLLGVERGIVVLTKRDLVDDEWFELVKEDVAERLQGTFLADAPFVAVSSTSGEGLETLIQTVDRMLTDLPPAPDYGRPRLWVDRVFSIKGAGTVVTGTLEGGSLTLETTVEIVPQGKRARVRGLQTHARTVQQAVPGTRVAVNLAGVETDELARGCALVGGLSEEPSLYVNVDLHLLPSAPHELTDLTTLKLYVGSAALTCRLRLLEDEVARPGERVLAQLWLERPAALRFGDRFVLRDGTYQKTVGGGRIVDERAFRVRRPSLRLIMPKSTLRLPGMDLDSELDLSLLRKRARIAFERADDYGRLVPVLLAEKGVLDKQQLMRAVPVTEEQLEAAIDSAVGKGEAIRLPSYVIEQSAWDVFVATLQRRLQNYHEEYPLRPGLGRETVRSGLDLPSRLFEESVDRLVRQGIVVAEGAHLRLPEHSLQFTAEQQEAIDRLLALLEAQPYAPPVWSELVGAHGFDAELLNALALRGDIVKVDDELVFSGAIMEQIQERVTSYIQATGSIDVRALRDMLQTSRKYALPVLEYFDRVELTRRVGDVRVLAG